MNVENVNAASTYAVAVEPETWAERAVTDESLRRFVDAEVGRAGVDAAAWRCEAEHWRRVAGDLRARLDMMQTSDDRARRGNRDRQIAHRRRTQFAAPLTEEM